MAFVSGAHQRVFASVFPASSLTSTVPTPVATPNPSFVAPGQPFGGPLPHKDATSRNGDALNHVANQLQWDRAWHTVTSFLRLPDEMIPMALGEFDVSQLGRKWIKSLNQETSQATAFLLSERSPGYDSLLGSGEDAIIEWYSSEIQRHYLAYIQPQVLQACCGTLLANFGGG